MTGVMARSKVQATERGKGEIHNVKSPAGTAGNLRTEPVESSKSQSKQFFLGLV